MSRWWWNEIVPKAAADASTCYVLYFVLIPVLPSPKLAHSLRLCYMLETQKYNMKYSNVINKYLKITTYRHFMMYISSRFQERV